MILCRRLLSYKVAAIILLMQCGYAGDLYYYQNNQKIILTPYHDKFTRLSNVDYYKNNKGLVVGVTEKIIIKTKDDTNIEKYLDGFKLILLKKLDAAIYLLKTSDKSLTIETVNKLQEQKDIIYAHPDFIKRRVLR